MQLTNEFLLAVMPTARSEYVSALLNQQDLLTNYGIKTADDLCYWIGQIAVETGGLNRLEENLTYTSTARLMAVWPSRFKTAAEAQPYVRNPSKLANLVYAKRLGNVLPDDGYNYRGSGTLQTTGRANFAEVDQSSDTGCVAKPDLLRRFPGAIVSSGIFWKKRSLGKYVAAHDLNGLRKAINGGMVGIDEAKRYTDRAMKAANLLRADDVSAGAPATPAATQPDYLRRGMTDRRVADAQMKLQKLGFYEGGKIDSFFGDATEDAVKEFQVSVGLAQDGVIGPLTAKALAAATPRPAPPSSPPATTPSRELPNWLEWIYGLLRAVFGKD